MDRLPKKAVVIIPIAEYCQLCEALGSTPDAAITDLIEKAKILVRNRQNYARQVIELEGKLLKKCPELTA